MIRYNVYMADYSEVSCIALVNISRYLRYSNHSYSIKLLETGEIIGKIKHFPFMDIDEGFSAAGVMKEILDSQFQFGDMKVTMVTNFISHSLSVLYSSFSRSYWESGEAIPCLSIVINGKATIQNDLPRKYDLKNYLVYRIINKSICVSGILGGKHVGRWISESSNKNFHIFGGAILAAAVVNTMEGKIQFHVSLDSDRIQCNWNKGSKKSTSINTPGAICVVGCGGTGSDFIKVLGKLLKESKLPVYLVDGDSVEMKNCARQAFTERDSLRKKTEIMQEGLCAYGVNRDQIITYPFYLTKVEELEFLIKEQNIILVGAVDNHRARQILHQYYDKQEDCIYIDCANEYMVGEVVCSCKKNGKEVFPTRGKLFPEVLTDKGPRVTELSCGNLNISSPQHAMTNLFASSILYSLVNMAVKEHKLMTGLYFFDTSKVFARREVAYGTEK